LPAEVVALPQAATPAAGVPGGAERVITSSPQIYHKHPGFVPQTPAQMHGKPTLCHFFKGLIRQNAETNTVS